MQEKVDQLKARYQEIVDLAGAAAVLSWDQSTYMPPGGAAARGRQMATLRSIIQEKQTDPELGKLLDELLPYAESLPEDHDDAALIKVGKRDFERAIKVPVEFTRRRTAHSSESFAVWTRARHADDFKAVKPYLEKTLELSKEFAAFYPEYDHPMDAFISFSEYGMTKEEVETIFDDLRENLVPLVQKVAEQQESDDGVLRGDFPCEKQLAFAREMVQAFGYDYERGRDDPTHHPFMTKFGQGDVRITTRCDDNYLGDGLFATLHEAGHGMYEQGVNPALEGTPLARGASSGVHESQSRLWENIVGRDLGVWRHYYPDLQKTFPALQDVPLETFHRAVNHIEPTLIRVRADELTYNLHIMIRFGLEVDLHEGRLTVADLPQAWRDRYEEYLGITPPDDKDGVMQDIHWYSFQIGGVFQGYTLGNVLSGQYYEAALQAHPEIPEQLARGEFDTLHGWMQENIYRHGRKFTSQELTQRVTGSPIRTEPYFNYLRNKYGALYDL
jgi:carboxypeptidase Taq